MNITQKLIEAELIPAAMRYPALVANYNRLRAENERMRGVLCRFTDWAAQDTTGAARDLQGIVCEAHQTLER